MRKTIRVGSRDSRLAVVQARLVMDAIGRFRPDLDLELVAMKTTGDNILDRPLDAIGGKGLFVKELDAALMEGRVDICVHSCKDLPIPEPAELPLVAFLPREDPRDVLILPPDGREYRDRPLGTSSHRRRLQLSVLYHGWTCEPVRGNLDTRLAKLDGGRYGGLVLAAAGVKRLGLWERVSVPFSAAELIPAAGQGVIAVQARAGEEHAFLAAIDNADSRDAVTAERAFVERLGGGCSSPVAAHAEVNGYNLSLNAMHVDADGRMIRGHQSGSRAHAREIGIELAERLLKSA